jgi:hypothetical protein
MAPNTTANDPIQGAIEETISAISSLHMVAEAIDPPPTGTLCYLVETDKWAAHAYQHLQQALVYLRKVRPEDLNADQDRQQTPRP